MIIYLTAQLRRRSVEELNRASGLGSPALAALCATSQATKKNFFSSCKQSKRMMPQEAQMKFTQHIQPVH